MLGYLDHPADDFDVLLRGGPFDNAGADGGSRVRATPEAKRVLPFGPDHSHDAVMAQLGLTGSGKNRHPTNDGFVVSYERKAGGLVPVTLAGVPGPALASSHRRTRAPPPPPNAPAPPP